MVVIPPSWIFDKFDERREVLSILCYTLCGMRIITIITNNEHV